MFVLFQLLVYSEKLDEALQVLTEYQDTNPDNPCAMRYLYNFYQEHYPDSEQTLALQKVTCLLFFIGMLLNSQIEHYRKVKPHHKILRLSLFGQI